MDVVDRITQIVARVSSRMFGGTSLSRNKEWVQSSINFATDGFIGAQALKKYPEVLKPIVARFVPAIRRIREHYAAAEQAAIPLLREREAAGTTAPDLLYWMAEEARGAERDPAFLASILLTVSFAAIHTSAAAPTQLLYDLCAMPEYVGPLRCEIEANVDHVTGFMSRQGFQNLKKLDSIMKESQRFNPLLLGRLFPSTLFCHFETADTIQPPLSGSSQKTTCCPTAWSYQPTRRWECPHTPSPWTRACFRSLLLSRGSGLLRRPRLLTAHGALQRAKLASFPSPTRPPIQRVWPLATDGTPVPGASSLRPRLRPSWCTC